MAIGRLTQLSPLINHQIDFHETLSTYLSKANTLVQVAMKNADFLGVLPHDYLWALSDIVGEARELNEDFLSFLLKTPASPTAH